MRPLYFRIRYQSNRFESRPSFLSERASDRWNRDQARGEGAGAAAARRAPERRGNRSKCLALDNLTCPWGRRILTLFLRARRRRAHGKHANSLRCAASRRSWVRSRADSWNRSGPWAHPCVIAAPTTRGTRSSPRGAIRCGWAAPTRRPPATPPASRTPRAPTPRPAPPRPLLDHLQRRGLQLPRAARRARGAGAPLRVAHRHRGGAGGVRPVGRRVALADERHVRLRHRRPRAANGVRGARPLGDQAALLLGLAGG